MKSKYTLIVAFFLALVAGLVAPVTASARHRVRVYIGTEPSYYYQPVPEYYYQPEVRVHYWHHGRWHREYHRDWR